MRFKWYHWVLLFIFGNLGSYFLGKAGVGWGSTEHWVILAVIFVIGFLLLRGGKR